MSSVWDRELKYRGVLSSFGHSLLFYWNLLVSLAYTGMSIYTCMYILKLHNENQLDSTYFS